MIRKNKKTRYHCFSNGQLTWPEPQESSDEKHLVLLFGEAGEVFGHPGHRQQLLHEAHVLLKQPTCATVRWVRPVYVMTCLDTQSRHQDAKLVLLTLQGRQPPQDRHLAQARSCAAVRAVSADLFSPRTVEWPRE